MILNQCNTVFAMRSFDDTGRKFLANYFGDDLANSLPELRERHAVLFGRASSCEDPVRLRLNDRDKFLRVFRAEYPPPTKNAEGVEDAVDAAPERDELG